MQLSVIVPTLNRAQYLHDMLVAMQHQTLAQDQYEIIVIDNGSTDNTREIVEALMSQIPLRYHYESELGLHHGRHAGLALAKFSCLVFADDDILPRPTWLEAIANAFKQPTVQIVTGNVYPKLLASEPKWFASLWASHEYGRLIAQYSVLEFGGQPREVSPYFVFGCNFAIRKSLILSVGGFHPDGMPKSHLHYRGDGESAVADALIKRGIEARFEPNAAVEHCVTAERLTLDYLRKRAYHEGISMSYRQIRRQNGWCWQHYLKQRLWFTINGRRRWILKGPLDALQYRAYAAGYLWHQRQARFSSDLLEWVLKPDYLETYRRLIS